MKHDSSQLCCSSCHTTRELVSSVFVERGDKAAEYGPTVRPLSFILYGFIDSNYRLEWNGRIKTMIKGTPVQLFWSVLWAARIFSSPRFSGPN